MLSSEKPDSSNSAAVNLAPHANSREVKPACFIVEADLSPVKGAEMCVAVMPEDPSVLDSMDSWNTKTHGDSGLIRRVREEGGSIREAEGQMMELLLKVYEEYDVRTF